MKKIKVLIESFKQELAIYQLVWKDPRTPRIAKWLLGIAITYLVSPVDLIPDFIPIVGQLDDLLIVPLCVYLALRIIPKSVIVESREKVSIQNRKK
ncbi:MAG: hypothetical protein A3C47_06730 [Omnitrophica bacterium RIFCSPHIGHO2_02_FULL_51_18]|nr:MAG: hypothetical protein A3C47_06730 [Omnitrophica bacterium RIFCSPHIGHO2_02_FULL_51_18]